MTDTIRQAYDKAFAATVSTGVPKSQQHMVACLAVKDAMEDTLENLIALRNVMTDNSLRYNRVRKTSGLHVSTKLGS